MTKLRSSRWSLAVATAFLTLVGGTLPTLALPDTSVKNLAVDAPLVSQVSSVSELTDVNPDTWAFQALKSLVERYGCIEGFPTKQFLGNEPIKRNEFAAGVTACLDKINELIAAGNTELVTKDDFATVQRLQAEQKSQYKSIVASIDNLEGKTKELEANLFSKTTKLDAEVVFQVLGATASGEIRGTNATTGFPTVNGGSQNVNFAGRVRLNLRSRNLVVKGDQLRIRLNGNTGDGSFYATGNSRVGRFDTAGAQGGGTTNGVAPVLFDKLTYEFPLPFDRNVRVIFGPRVESIDYLGTNLNTRSEGNNFSMRAFRRNVAISLVNTSVPGAAITWKINNQFDARAFYGATAGGDSFGYGGGGLTGPSQAAFELGYRPDPRFDAGIGYYRTICNSSNAAISVEAPSSQNRIFCDSSVGGSTRYPFSGGNAISNVAHDTFNAHFDWDVFPEIAFYGRYTFGTATLNDGQATGDRGAGITYNEFMAGITFKDPFGQRGNAIGLAFLQPANVVTNTQNFGTVPLNFGSTTFPAGASIPNASEKIYGLYYRMGMGKGITLTPEVYYITNPGSIDANPAVTVGTLKAVFTY